MTAFKFVIADVFTNERFGGNQLAVFTGPSGLDPEMMQKIAREMNYSETTFLFPPESGGDYRVRIFTPARELPFAGHPLVGSGYVIVAEHMKEWERPRTRLNLETGVGLIKLEVDTPGDVPGQSTMTQPLPEVRSVLSDPSRIAAALSLDAGDLMAPEFPVEAVYNGIIVMLVPARSRSAVERARVNTRELETLSREVSAETVLLFSTETVDTRSDVHCRVFAPEAGVAEDPATGSANGPLGWYLFRHHLVNRTSPLTNIISEQGYEMLRPSRLHIELSVDSQTEEVSRVRVGGGVVISGRGEIYA
jgi:trans-2,3-dihydro-3-hydroxyanthranilate isomerase